MAWIQFNKEGTKLLSAVSNLDEIYEDYRIWNCQSGDCIHQSETEPPTELFDQTTALEKYVAYEYGRWWTGADTRFNEEDVSFSGDVRIDGDTYFFTNTNGRREIACYVDGNNIHFLRAVEHLK